MVFKQPVLQDIIFEKFWNSVKVLHQKDDIIKYYEVGLSQILLKEKYTSAVRTNFQPTFSHNFNIFMRKLTPKKIVHKIYALLKGKNKLRHIAQSNPTHYFWEELICSGNVPFVKIELLRDNPMKINIKNIYNTINQVSTYDTSLIKNHLTRMKEHI